MLVYAATHAPPVAAAATLGVGAAGALGFGIGVGAACYVEMKLQEFEEKCKQGTYKVRWCVGTTVRVLLVGAGTSLAVTAAVGLISASLVVAVGVASCGVGLALVGVMAIGAAVLRYQQLSAQMREQERRDAAELLMGTLVHLPDARVREFVRSNELTLEHLTPHLKRMDIASATATFQRLFGLLHGTLIQ
jgi:hypothetical protein